MMIIGSGECDLTNGMSAWQVYRVTANSTPSSNDLVTHKLQESLTLGV